MAVIFTSIDRQGAQGRRQAIKRWLKDAVQNEGFLLGEVVIAFCSDAYITEENIKFLSHNYATDIITFDRTEGKTVSGDLLISIDRVKANAADYGVSFDDEFHRVIIHGVLHMTGYDDHTDHDRETMRAREDFYLQQLRLVSASVTSVIKKEASEN